MNLTLSLRPEEQLTLSEGPIRIHSAFCRPVLTPLPSAPLSAWSCAERERSPMVLGGKSGDVIRDSFTAPGIAVTREIWQDDEETSFAVRLRVTNGRSEPVPVECVRPFVADGPDALQMGASPVSEWEVLCQKRLKNDVPSALRPGTFDRDYSHASRGLSELGDELSAYDGITGIDADPFLLIRAGDDCPLLLAGYLEWDRHLAHVHLATDPTRCELSTLQAECLFNDAVLPPGGEVTTQWFALMTGTDEHRLIERYVEWLAQVNHIPVPPQSAPAVWCSWQYYGPSFTEEDLRENLTAIRERIDLPVDVLLIDECWDMNWGNWLGNDMWPSGMKDAADRMRVAGNRPGIWTCPFLARRDSLLVRDHSDWLLKHEDGTNVLFFMNTQHNFVLDPTVSGVTAWIEETFRRLTHDWGFTYHKMDFTRAVFQDAKARPYDRTKNLLQAYRMGMEAVRRGAGPDAYLSVCGGHFGGAMGIADSQRSGSDVYGFWDKPPAMPRIKQNIMRTWMSRLWHVDPDAMMVRRRDKPLNNTKHGMLAQGTFSDDEAITIAVNQYVGGQMVCLCERLAEIDDDRLALYRHVLPSVDSPSIPLDPFRPECPSRMLTRIMPRCANLTPWATVTCINWEDDPVEMDVTLDGRVCADFAGDRVLAFELVTKTLLGVFGHRETLPIGDVPPHASRIIRLAPWCPEDGPILAGTDLHFSGGGVEIAEWNTALDGTITGRLQTPWPYPVTITAAFSGQDDTSPVLRTITVNDAREDGRFQIPAPDDCPMACDT